MNSGLLVVVALFLIWLAVTGRYSCVTAAAKCVFSGDKLCACGPGGRPVAGQKGPSVTGLPGAVRGGITAGRDLLKGARDIIDAARGK